MLFITKNLLILLCNIKKLASYDEVKWADNSIMDASTRYNVHTKTCVHLNRLSVKCFVQGHCIARLA